MAIIRTPYRVHRPIEAITRHREKKIEIFQRPAYCSMYIEIVSGSEEWRKKKSGDEWWEPNQRRALVFAKRSRLMTSSRLSNISSHCTTPEKCSDTEIKSTEQQQSKKYWIEVLSTPPLAVFSLSLSCSLIIHGTRNTSNIIQLAQVVSFNLCKSTSYKNIHFQTIGE